MQGLKATSLVSWRGGRGTIAFSQGFVGRMRGCCVNPATAFTHASFVVPLQRTQAVRPFSAATISRQQRVQFTVVAQKAVNRKQQVWGCSDGAGCNGVAAAGGGGGHVSWFGGSTGVTDGGSCSNSHTL